MTISRTKRCTSCNRKLVWHEGAHSGWVHSNDFEENQQLGQECRERAGKLYLKDLIAWGDSLSWGDLPARPGRAFGQFRSTGRRVRGDKNVDMLIARYKALKGHPNRHLIQSISFVDDIIRGKVQV